jgi:transcriptional regulator with XRE-family HTH domain
MSEFPDWLKRKYLDWQHDQGDLKTMIQFAEYLGVTQQSLSAWVNGKSPPTGDNLLKLADKLGYEVYDILGVELPVSDPRLLLVMKNWERFTEAVKEEFKRMAQQAQSVSYVSEKKGRR